MDFRTDTLPQGLMEWQHMLVSSHQNTHENGYGQQRTEKPVLAMWARFYNMPKDEYVLS